MFQTFSPTHSLTGQDFPTSLNAFDQTITRDSVQRVTALTPSIGTTVRKFTYDTLGQLLNACDKPGSASCLNEFGATTNAYVFDSAGNRKDGSSIIAPGNRVTAFRGWNVGYDLTGNVASKYQPPYNPATARTYTWDALGRLTAVTIGPDTVARFRYDALGRRVLKITGTTTPDSLWFVYNAGAQVLADLGGNGATNMVRAEYGYAPGGDQVLSVRQPVTGLDGVLILDPMIGSVRGVASWSSGAVIKDYRTTLAAANPWGTTPADTGAIVRFRWAGREYDQETGLYYMRARYYDPQLGRFLSEDPIGVDGGLNLYQYAGNNAVMASDPTGLVLVCVDGPLVYEYSYWENTDEGRRQVNVWTQWQNCYDTDAMGQGVGEPSTSSNKGATKPDATADDPGKCDAAPAVGLGYTAWGSIGAGPFGAGGVYANTAGEGGTFVTTGTAYGLGGGVISGDVQFSTSTAALAGSSQGLCVMFKVGVCVTGNRSGLNITLGFGPGYGAAWVDTKTIPTPAPPTACKK